MTARGDGADVAAVFGRRVRAERTARGWLQRDLADASGVGTSTLSRTENGADPALALAAAIARGLGMPLAVLLAGMLPEPACGHCLDAPPRGFTCQECGTPGPAVTA
jgi:transcriptional regulator with XRE-family HTH domain